MTEDSAAKGVWCLMQNDYSGEVISIFGDELSALRRMNEICYGKVHFIPFGVDCHEYQQQDYQKGGGHD